MEEDWKRIFSSPKMHVALLIKAMLEAHEMEVVMIDKQDQNYLFGFKELYVLKVNEAKALEIIADEYKSE